LLRCSIVALSLIVAARALATDTSEAAVQTDSAGSARPGSVDRADSSEDAAGTPTAVVEQLHAALIGVMKDASTLGYEGRYERLEPVLASTFDLAFMAEKSAGRHWKDFSAEQRASWLATFERFTIANYAGRFDGFSGQRFETGAQEAASHETIVVRTTLVNPADEDVQLNYRLRETEAGWRIIDVYLHGTVSELALRRAEYSAALDREGFDKVLADLDRKVADLSTPEGS
jgi:phospholipid transport system substrate-binding protein